MIKEHDLPNSVSHVIHVCMFYVTVTRHQLFLNREEKSWSVQQINSTIVYKMGICCTCMYISWVLQITLPSPFLYTVLIDKMISGGRAVGVFLMLDFISWLLLLYYYYCYCKIIHIVFQLCLYGKETEI